MAHTVALGWVYFCGVVELKTRIKLAEEHSVLFQSHGSILRDKTHREKKHTGRQTQNKTAK